MSKYTELSSFFIDKMSQETEKQQNIIKHLEELKSNLITFLGCPNDSVNFPKLKFNELGSYESEISVKFSIFDRQNNRAEKALNLPIYGKYLQEQNISFNNKKFNFVSYDIISENIFEELKNLYKPSPKSGRI